jgi:hypothetical protein
VTVTVSFFVVPLPSETEITASPLASANSSPPFTDNDIAKDMLMTYIHDGAESLCERYSNEHPAHRTSFALFDEGCRFVMLFAVTSRFYVTHEEDSERIFFSTDERALCALSQMGIRLHYPAHKILSYGVALHCDVRQDTNEKNRTHTPSDE